MGECNMGLLRGVSCLLLCMHGARSFFSPWNTYIAGLRTQEPSHLPPRPRPPVVEPLVNKRGEDEPRDDEEAPELSEDEARAGVSFSITANFQALQQKLMRELFTRSSSRNRDVVARSRILR